MNAQFKQNRFRSRYDGFHRRVMVWACKACGAWHENTKPMTCVSCRGVEFIYFASRAEAKRGAELLLQVRAKLIRNLKAQVTFPLAVNGVKIFPRGYVADFVYYMCETGEMIVEDVKADSKDDKAITELFKAKAKLMGAIHGIKINIVKRS